MIILLIHIPIYMYIPFYCYAFIIIIIIIGSIMLITFALLKVIVYSTHGWVILPN